MCLLSRLSSLCVSLFYFASFCLFLFFFFFSSRRRHTRSVSAFLLNRSSDLEKWFLENEKTVTQFCRKLAAERPLKDIRDEYNYPKKKGIKDECSRLLEASTMKSRRGFAIQRLMNAMRQAHAD